MLESLPVVDSCDGCGACCLEQGAPPDYVALRLNPHFADAPSFADDAARLTKLPPQAQRLLDEYFENTVRGSLPRNRPCVWYDDALQNCRFYDLRPSTCRVFETGSMGCLLYRRRHGLATPAE
jgi:Fe-S-cluster containining protein